jgi:diguanylate cyclase
MAINRSEYERTLAIAETALSRIKALRLAANPRNFEIWYTYAVGGNEALNHSINETLRKDENISEHDLGQIYQQFLSTVHLPEQADEIGSRISGEIERVMSTIDLAIGSANI